MTSLALQRRWQKVRLLLQEALEIERERIGPEQATYVAEFVAHNELGLACDQLIDALSELELSPTAQSAVLLVQAQELMT